MTRFPGLVPAGVEAIELPARLAGAAHGLVAAAAAAPARARARALPARGAARLERAAPSSRVHDLSFERDPTAMGRLDRATFKWVVPRAVRRADHVLAVSERTKRDIVELYGIAPEKVTVTPNGVDATFFPDRRHGERARRTCSSSARSSGARIRSPRSRPRASVGLPLVVAGPEKEPELARELRAGGADLRGYVPTPELADLYRGAAALVLPSRFEGFGLPVLEAMACGAPVVAADEPALREVAGDAAVYAEDGDFGAAVRRALDERERARRRRARAGEALLVGRDRAAHGRGLPAGARVKVSAVVVSHGQRRAARGVAAGARAAGRRAGRRRERAGLGAAGRRGDPQRERRSATRRT